MKNVPSEDEDRRLESPRMRRQRWFSIYVIYFTVFLMTLGFSIILTGVWPYLDKLDPRAGKEFMGLVVGANPLGQMLFSPLLGWWSNRLGSIRAPLLVSLALFTAASAAYSLLEALTAHRKLWMLAARFLVGVSSANIAVCRSYLSAATTLEERTGAVSMVSLAQVLGFVVGPGLQALVTPLGDEGVRMPAGLPALNMYTAAGWINVALGAVNTLLFLPAVFTEHRVAAKEAMLQQGASSEEETWSGVKPDYLSTWTLISAFFVIGFNFVLLETLGTSLTMDQFAWSKGEALYYMGLVMSAGAVLACATFLAIGPLCRRFDERKVLLWGGFFVMVVGRVLCIPWGSEPARIAWPVNATGAGDGSEGNRTEPLGCPPSQEWCLYTPAMTLTQFLLGYAFTSVAYPIGITLIQTIFSKILGPRPQGVWMGLMTGAGCLSRVLGPVFVSYIYTELGTIWTFSLTVAMMGACMVWLAAVDRRMKRAMPARVGFPLRGDAARVT
ncbi:major facilitator superfamily domain-containing protein 8 [Bacillus rossius redtenbacheri]|uniref:major facilitator superfamily domain-containing protein 8 n=1 Tax=Bacillus rossius redtenbacheri TaxID=93214 RepID=UPI002FDE851F